MHTHGFNLSLRAGKAFRVKNPHIQHPFVSEPPRAWKNWSRCSVPWPLKSQRSKSKRAFVPACVRLALAIQGLAFPCAEP